VGKTDTAPALVRKQYPGTIIGATANTWEDVQRLADAPIDYIGLGPLRFTTTKKKLSPILGLEGYRSILGRMAAASINIPVLAIGGVVEADVAPLRQLGVWGVAVSGLLAQSDEPQPLMKRLLE
jgi:thiamine-phosphate pyrophosphorylase